MSIWFSGLCGVRVYVVLWLMWFLSLRGFRMCVISGVCVYSRVYVFSRPMCFYGLCGFMGYVILRRM